MINLSVVLPVYNVEQYIKECILSLQNQTFKDFEVIIVDDGSNDSSIDIASELIKDDLRFTIVKKDNGGLSDARNYGAKLAKGKFITFVDSDDFLDVNLFKKAMNKALNENLDIVVYDFVKYYENGKKTIRKSHYIENDPYSLIRESINACNKIIRTEIWKKNHIKFPVGIWYEDLATIPSLLNFTFQIGYIDNTFYYYRIRQGSITNQHVYNEKVMDVLKAFDYLKNHLSKNFPKDEYEYLLILHILYMGTQRVVQFNKKKEFDMLISYVTRTCPMWYKNKNINNLPKIKQLYLLCIKYNSFILCKVLVYLRCKLQGGIA